jgi:hypothetical protein
MKIVKFAEKRSISVSEERNDGSVNSETQQPGRRRALSESIGAMSQLFADEGRGIEENVLSEDAVSDARADDNSGQAGCSKDRGEGIQEPDQRDEDAAAPENGADQAIALNGDVGGGRSVAKRLRNILRISRTDNCRRPADAEASAEPENEQPAGNAVQGQVQPAPARPGLLRRAMDWIRSHWQEADTAYEEVWNWFNSLKDLDCSNCADLDL